MAMVDHLESMAMCWEEMERSGEVRLASEEIKGDVGVK